MTKAQARLIEHAYWGPSETGSPFWFAFIGLWLGGLTQFWVIAHPSAWKDHKA